MRKMRMVERSRASAPISETRITRKLLFSFHVHVLSLHLSNRPCRWTSPVALYSFTVHELQRNQRDLFHFVTTEVSDPLTKYVRQQWWALRQVNRENQQRLSRNDRISFRLERRSSFLPAEWRDGGEYVRMVSRTSIIYGCGRHVCFLPFYSPPKDKLLVDRSVIAQSTSTNVFSVRRIPSSSTIPSRMIEGFRQSSMVGSLDMRYWPLLILFFVSGQANQILPRINRVSIW